MFKLIRVKGDSWVFRAPTNLGVIITDNDAIVIDTGYGEDKVRKLLRVLKVIKKRVKIIINTHCHADHIDGNNFLKKRTNALIYAPRKELSFIENPELHMRMFFNHAIPLLTLGTKFMVARGSCVDEPIDEGEIKVLNRQLKIISLPGHSPGQIGILSDDDVFYIGDAVFTQQILNKYPLLFYVDIDDLLSSFEKLREVHADYFVPGHGEILTRKELIDTIKLYTSRINYVNNLILEILEKPTSLDDLISAVNRTLGTPPDLTQYYLSKTTIMAHVSYLFKHNKIKMHLENYKLILECQA